ncbi:hypothetical protein IWZ01DRAFT_479704 [Phyllosticta capitalensis]
MGPPKLAHHSCFLPNYEVAPLNIERGASRWYPARSLARRGDGRLDGRRIEAARHFDARRGVLVRRGVTLDTTGGAVTAAAAQQAGAVVTTVEHADIELEFLELELDFLVELLLFLLDDLDVEVTTRTDMSKMSRTRLSATVSVTVATGAATVEFFRRVELRLLLLLLLLDDASALPRPVAAVLLVDVAVVWAPAKKAPVAKTRKETSLMMRCAGKVDVLGPSPLGKTTQRA